MASVRARASRRAPPRRSPSYNRPMVSAAKPVVCIVTPGTRNANNGNWRTAARWAEMLSDRFRVIVQTQWDGTAADALFALHARRSAASIERFRERAPGRRIAVVLTGTDLYEDLPGSVEATRSIDLADRLVVLQEHALRLLDGRWRAKTQLIFQSALALAPRRKRRDRLDCVGVGPLRDEKDPLTLFRAVELVAPDASIAILHVAAPLHANLRA